MKPRRRPNTGPSWKSSLQSSRVCPPSHIKKEWCRDLTSVVTGEKVITPSAIVHLTYKCRYVYPSTTVPKSQLPNGPVTLPNGDHDSDGKKSADDVTENGTDEKEIKEKVDDVKDAIVAKKDKLLGQKGKEATPKIDYPPNGYAHAPHWPLVSNVKDYLHAEIEPADEIIAT